jgi:hypothetical protein
MTLGELKADLKNYGIEEVGILRSRRLPNEGSPDQWESTTIYFSSDKKIVVPFRPKNMYSLSVKTGHDDEVVHSEKIKALKRSLIPGWDDV